MAELTLPKVDFSPLGELGEIYKKGQDERGLKDAFSQGIGSDPQSLAALAAREQSQTQIEPSDRRLLIHFDGGSRVIKEVLKFLTLIKDPRAIY